MNRFIYPTHKCFDDALDFLEELARQKNPALYRMRLVHGICLHPDDGHEYAHAWVEQDGTCVIFSGILNGKFGYFAASIEEYYPDAKVQETTKYTPFEAWRENHRTNHYGPWIEKYQRLCRTPNMEAKDGLAQ